GKPTNGTSRTGRSNQRFTVMIGDEAIAPARAISFESSGGCGSNTAERANQGTAETTVLAGQRSPPPSTATTRAASTLTRAVTPVITLPPRPSTYFRAGSAYIMSSGLVGNAIAEARG